MSQEKREKLISELIKFIDLLIPRIPEIVAVIKANQNQTMGWWQKAALLTSYLWNNADNQRDLWGIGERFSGLLNIAVAGKRKISNEVKTKTMLQKQTGYDVYIAYQNDSDEYKKSFCRNTLFIQKKQRILLKYHFLI